jgi:uncharacterized SAM-binding protein YcdF (DUF218 family)
LRRRKLVASAVTAVAFVIVVTSTHAIWLRWIGGALVTAGPPVKADAALVLAGDPRGNRIKTAAELVRLGYVPKVLVSGPSEWYGLNEADLAIRFATAHEYPREWFEPLIIQALSTDDEARALVSAVEKRGIRKLLIVTSDFHTRRAGRVYRRTIPSSIEFRMVAAPDKYFVPDGWWRNREGRKTVFFEVSKTIADWVGL